MHSNERQAQGILMEAAGQDTISVADFRVRKAALILSMIGLEEAVAICKRVDPLTAHRLIRALATLGRVETADRERTARDVVAHIKGGDQDAESLAAALKERVLGTRNGLGSFGNEETEMSFERLSLLDKADPGLLWRAVSDEMPQAIALIARHLSPANVARLLAAMPEETRGDVAYRMALPRPATTGALKAFSRVSDRLIKVADSGGASSADGQTRFVVDVISQLTRTDAQKIIGAIKDRSEEIGTQIEQMIFNFTDLLRLPGPSLQTILRNVSTGDLALALKGVPEELRIVVLNNLSQRARAVLEEEVGLLGPVPASEAERAQREIVQVARTLDSTGEISLEPGAVEYVE
jgi:flagellar motor switch protein FliG